MRGNDNDRVRADEETHKGLRTTPYRTVEWKTEGNDASVENGIEPRPGMIL